MQDYTEAKAKVTELARAGFVQGVGERREGGLCVMAAVAWALGLPHGDKARECTHEADERLLIRLNDLRWSSDKVRGVAMLPLALAAMGTAGSDRAPWAARVVESTIRKIVPLPLRAAASMPGNAEHKKRLEDAAVRCEQEGTAEAARHARKIAAAYAYDAAAAYDSAAAVRDKVLLAFRDVVLEAYAAEGRA